MVDITSINSATRKWLDQQGWLDVDLDKPLYENGYWIVIVLNGGVVLGTVILTGDGKVKESLSFPNRP